MKHKKCFFFVYLWYNKMGDFMKQIRAAFIMLVIIIAGIFGYSFYSREKLKKEKIAHNYIFYKEQGHIFGILTIVIFLLKWYNTNNIAEFGA